MIQCTNSTAARDSVGLVLKPLFDTISIPIRQLLELDDTSQVPQTTCRDLWIETILQTIVTFIVNILQNRVLESKIAASKRV